MTTKHTPPTFDEKLDKFLVSFAIDIHGAKPGEDETKYFEEAKASIKQLFIDTIDDWDSDNMYGSDPRELRDTITKVSKSRALLGKENT